MAAVVKIDTVHQYNEMRAVPTLHPLVSVIDLSKAKAMPARTFNFGLYAVYLKQIKNGALRYGRHYYDYQEGTLVFVGPGQVVGKQQPREKVPEPRGWVLIFHPDLIKGTPLGKHIHDYSFFSYDVNEALHLSEQEQQTVLDLFGKIADELQRPVDKHSRTLIAGAIELFLNYGLRFYDRQFITRDQAHKDVLSRFEKLLHDYLYASDLQEQGLPTVSYCAEQLNLSANYFGDLVKKATGRSAHDYIQAKVIDIAKERIFDTTKSVSEIAYGLGFKYPQHFTRLFKQKVGLTPQEYRSQN